ncbi:hypothetical protein QG37_04606 [Candidozyma auris]|nr:hypothetical protein QG37_04606 [[Candida] auris]
MLSGTQGSRRVGSWPSPCEEEENGKSKGRIRELKRTVKREVSRKSFEPWILFFFEAVGDYNGDHIGGCGLCAQKWLQMRQGPVRPVVSKA